MVTPDDWTRLSARIHGLIEAARLAAAMLPGTTDIYGAFKLLRQQAAEVLTDLDHFADTLDVSTGVAQTTIKTFVQHRSALFTDESGTQEARQSQARTSLVMLAALEAEVTHLLRDQELAIRNRSERAFEHLQRLIVVDNAFRKKWQTAFSRGEVACEKLGAVHLLSQGIWPFKVDAAGGRTDLVYQEPLKDTSVVKRSADGLILTEWKKLPKGGDSATCFESARDQAACYATGVLAGTELTRYRYAILVSRLQVNVPDDVERGGVVYRHINIAVMPRVPSKV